MSSAEILPVTAESIARASAMLREGRLVVFPTDTVYGVGAGLDRPEAVARLFVAKGRPLDRPIAVLVSDIDAVSRLTPDIDPRVERLLERFWPGALTVVLAAAEWLPEEVMRGTGRVGIRLPDHPLACEIIRGAGGAVATTSANRSGEQDARTAQEAAEALGERVDLIVDGGLVPGGVPSTVVAVEGDALRILRQGVISPDQLPSNLFSIAG